MRLLRPLLRRYAGLPPAISRTERASEWIAMGDGTRLETVVIHPVDVASPSSCLLVRSEQALPCEWASLFAEQGHLVVMQQCRGRLDSEGSFEPFVSEGSDGADTVDWIHDQPWFRGRLGVAGFGYAGFAAWAALARRPEAVDAVAVGLASRDPHRSLYVGGALQLEWALHLASQLSEGSELADLDRGVRTRPIIEADRVALRRIPWFREWLAHPTADAFWKERTPDLPGAPPPSLLFAGHHHPTLAGQLSDYALLREARAAPELVIGPWGESPMPRKERSRWTGLVMVTARMMVDFFDRVLKGQGDGNGHVQIFMGGSERWYESTTWPPATAEPRTLFLHGDEEEGLLSLDPPKADALPGHFLYDPADARPSQVGASVRRPGIALPMDADWRGDALRFHTGSLESDLEIVGPASVVLHVSSDAAATDFTARLIESDSAGHLKLLGEGVGRTRELSPNVPRRIEIELHAIARRVPAGSVLRLEIASASFPRFDRHPNLDTELARCEPEDARPAHQTVHHDAEHASCLTLMVAAA